MAQPKKEVTRNRNTDVKYVNPDPQKSGLNLSYRTYNDFMLGRIHVSGYQDIMPADNFVGSNTFNGTMNDLQVPMVSPLNVAQHNFYVTLRSIDNTFEDAFAPSALNNMSTGWHAPTFRLNELVRSYLDPVTHAMVNTIATNGVQATVNTTVELAYKAVVKKLSEELGVDNAHYLADSLDDLQSYWASTYQSVVDATSTDRQARLAAVVRWLCRPILGTGSLLCELGYPVLLDTDYRALCKDWDLDHSLGVCVGANTISIPLNEYKLRAYYAIWFSAFRDINLEPKNSFTIDYRQFGSSPRVTADDFSLLFRRIRSWNPDMFIGAQVDDMMRHVYAPIMGQQNSDVISDTTLQGDYPYAGFDAYDVNHASIRGYTLTYRDPLSGEGKYLVCPVPGSVNDYLSRASLSSDSSYALDLRNLKQAQALDKYLKKNFIGGDEYQDRMLVQYGSRVSDLRVNHPQLLSGSVTGADMNQQISSITVPGGSSAGERIATGNLGGKGDGYSFFAEEFGFVINILTLVPEAMYNGINPQNLLYNQIDYPVPVFAASNEELGRICEIAYTSRVYDQDDPNADAQWKFFGHYSYAHAWRGRVNEVKGSFTYEKSNYTFNRFFGMDATEDGLPKLNYQFIHCRPSLAMFRNTNRFDGQCYGSVQHEFYVERALPVPVEVL